MRFLGRTLERQFKLGDATYRLHPPSRSRLPFACIDYLRILNLTMP